MFDGNNLGWFTWERTIIWSYRHRILENDGTVFRKCLKKFNFVAKQVQLLLGKLIA